METTGTLDTAGEQALCRGLETLRRTVAAAHAVKPAPTIDRTPCRRQRTHRWHSTTRGGRECHARHRGSACSTGSHPVGRRGPVRRIDAAAIARALSLLPPATRVYPRPGTARLGAVLRRAGFCRRLQRTCAGCGRPGPGDIGALRGWNAGRGVLRRAADVPGWLGAMPSRRRYTQAAA